MKYSYCYFEIVLHLFVAFTFLIEVFKGKLPQKLYDFFNNNSKEVLNVRSISCSGV